MGTGLFLIILTVLSSMLSPASAQQLLLGSSELTRGDEQETVVSRLRREFRLSLSMLKPGPELETFEVTRLETNAVVGHVTFLRSRLVSASVRVADCPVSSPTNCVLDAFFDTVLQHGGKRDNMFIGRAHLAEKTLYSMLGSRALGQCLPNGLMVVAKWPSPLTSGGESFVSLQMSEVSSYCEK